MAANDFTMKNKGCGIHGQPILDAGLNVFALQLLLESFTETIGKDTEPVEFTYLGVKVRLQIDENAI